MVQRQGWESHNMQLMLLGTWSLLNCLSRAGRLWSTYFIDYRCIEMFGKPSEVPTYANQVSKGEEVGAVESVKAASEVEFTEKLKLGNLGGKKCPCAGVQSSDWHCGCIK